MSSCVNHSGVPAYTQCNRCGAYICMECRFSDEIANRVIAFSSVDQAREIDYANFCPNCMVEWGREMGYDDPGKWMKDKGSLFMIIMGIVTIPFYGAGLIIIPIAIAMFACGRNEHMKKHNLYLKALNMTELLQYRNQLNPNPDNINSYP